MRALRAWARECGQPPRAEDWSAASQAKLATRAFRNRGIDKAASWPSPTTVRRYFGSWSAALDAAGLRSGRLAPWGLSLAERVATARRLSARGLTTAQVARELELSAPTIAKYLRAGVCPDCSGPLVTERAKRCHLCDVRSRRASYSDAKTRAAMHEYSRDRRAIILALHRIALAEGRRPLWTDLHPKRPGLPSYGKTLSVFGSFGEALEAAGFRPRGEIWAPGEVVVALRSWSRAHGRSPISKDWSRTTRDHPGSRAVADLFGSWSAALEAAGLQRRWGRADVLEALRSWNAEHGRLPTSKEWQSADHRRRPTTHTVRTQFGTWSVALAAADRHASRSRR